MLLANDFSQLAKVLKGLASIYSVQFNSAFMESDMKVDIEAIKTEFRNCNGKKYGFALTIGIRKNGTNNSLGGLFRSYLDNDDFVFFYNIIFSPDTKKWEVKKVTENEIFF